MKNNNYRVTIEAIDPAVETGANTMTFEFQDREDVFNAVDKIRQGSGLDENSATRMAVALRLLGPVMMKDRKNPLFAEFFPHFKDFMQHLKRIVKSGLR